MVLDVPFVASPPPSDNPSSVIKKMSSPQSASKPPTETRVQLTIVSDLRNGPDNQALIRETYTGSIQHLKKRGDQICLETGAHSHDVGFFFFARWKKLAGV